MPDAPLTDQQHTDIRAREQAATPGPWTVEWDHDDASDQPFPVSLGPIRYLEHQGEREVADAEFISHAREDVPALLAEVDRLRAEQEQHRDQVLTEAAQALTIYADIGFPVVSPDGQVQLSPAQLRFAASLLPARTTTAQEQPMQHCTAPNALMPCGIHCRHDLCADCDRCCTCQCANAQEQPR